MVQFIIYYFLMFSNFTIPAQIANARILMAYNKSAIIERLQAGMKIKDVYSELIPIVLKNHSDFKMSYETFRRHANSYDQQSPPSLPTPKKSFKADEYSPTKSAINEDQKSSIDPSEKHDESDLF